MSGHVPLAPTDREWAEALASLSGEATPERVDAALRDVLHVPAPRDPNACRRCKGTGGIAVGPGLAAWELEFDECPTCGGTGTRSD